MCGRYSLSTSPEDIVNEFSDEINFLGLEELNSSYDWQPRFNIAPSQYSLVAAEPENTPQLALMRWGLVPHWAKDEKIGYKMINARAETVAEKPAFRGAFRHKLCLVFATVYYEWVKQDGAKQAIYITPKNNHTIGFAGLWEQWFSPDQSPLLSYTVITTTASADMESLHHRMPVVLSPNNFETWLTSNTDTKGALALLRPSPSDTFSVTPVSNYVNSPRNEGPKCIQALPNQAQ